MNFDEVDREIREDHENTRADLYELTTGELYTRWKDGMVNDDLEKA